MQKKLVTFGDSWPWGAELNATEKPFGFWIAEDLGYEFENCAEEGTSIEHMILQLQKYTAKNKMDTTAIFFITNPCIFGIHNNRNIITISKIKP